MTNDRVLFCGHPIECTSEMSPDFFGDTPETQRIGTVYCRWCEEVARIKAHVKELEAQLGRQCPVIRAARWAEELSHADDIDLEGPSRVAFERALGRVMSAIRVLDAAVAAEREE